MDVLETQWVTHQKSLLTFIRKRVGSRDVAEDILHDVFIKFYTKFSTIADHSMIRSWLFRVTRNTIIDYYRARTVTQELPDDLESSIGQREESVQQTLSACVEKMVLQLPQKYRVAIEITELENRPQHELAALEQISLSGAKSRVQRGRKMLQAMMFDCCAFDLDVHNRVIDWVPRNRDCQCC